MVSKYILLPLPSLRPPPPNKDVFESKAGKPWKLYVLDVKSVKQMENKRGVHSTVFVMLASSPVELGKEGNISVFWLSITLAF